QQQGLSTLAGTVRLRLGANEFQARALSYDEQTRRVHVDAESTFRNRTLVIRSHKADFDLASETGTFLDNEFTIVPRAARGGAARIDLARDGTAGIRDVYYTTCAPGSNAWFLEASEIELDQQEGVGTARNARLRFGYVPILYAPWFRFPIDNRRRTGFLFPTMGLSDRNGFDFRIPFYLNLAPNYDAELIPRYMARRGLQLGTEGRYLFPGHKGAALFEVLNDQERERRRSYLHFDHDGLINRRLGVAARYGKVSDPQYFEDLGGQLDTASITHLERSVRLTYAAPAAYSVSARVTDYQTVASNVNPQFEPHRRQPELRVAALTPRTWHDLRAGFDGEYVNFVRSLPPEGQRLDLDPYVRFLRDTTGWYVGSQVDWRYTRYRVRGAAGDPGPERLLPIVSAESGLRFDRPTDSGELQTLEPRLFYLYVPYRNQDELPVFDTGEPDFDFVQLFARNRFSGQDRIADANHLTATFTTRLLDPASGNAHLVVSLGQIYRFQAPRLLVNQPGFSTQAPGRGGTDYVAELQYSPLQALSWMSAAQWSPDTGDFIRASTGLRLRTDRVRADLSYRYRRDVFVSGTSTTTPTPITIEQTDLSGLVPVLGGLSAIGRVRYSLAEARTLEALGGAEYKTCCWAMRAAYRRYQFSFDPTTLAPLYTTGVYFQLELTGLTRIGAGFQSLLPSLE
ncbi:MAG TPA: LPS assembly protein LptD, partial [Candidatus Binatia bacterium]|nr:LPS assembly protein LptD [Candidatus Binatia bacterium]